MWCVAAAYPLSVSECDLFLMALFRTEIVYPSMRALARQLGREGEYRLPLVDNQPIPPPTGASEADIKAQQVQNSVAHIICTSPLSKEFDLVESQNRHRLTHSHVLQPVIRSFLIFLMSALPHYSEQHPMTPT